MKCQFCGSEKTMIETPYVELNDKGEYVPKKTWCCTAQKKNAQFITKRYDPSRGDVPDDVSEL